MRFFFNLLFLAGSTHTHTPPSPRAFSPSLPPSLSLSLSLSLHTHILWRMKINNLGSLSELFLQAPFFPRLSLFLSSGFFSHEKRGSKEREREAKALSRRTAFPQKNCRCTSLSVRGGGDSLPHRRIQNDAFSRTREQTEREKTERKREKTCIFKTRSCSFSSSLK